MTNSQIDFTNNDKKQIVISVRKSPLFIRIALMIVFILFIIGPILGLVIMIMEKERLKFGTFISFALFWGFAYYVFRVLSWNTFGKEHFSFTEKVQYYSDFKYFKDSFKEFDNSDLSFEFEEIGYKEDNEGILIIKNSNETLKSVIKVKIPELKESIERLKKTTPNNV